MRLHVSSDGSVDLDGYHERQRLIDAQRQVLVDALRDNPDAVLTPHVERKPVSLRPRANYKRMLFNVLAERDGTTCYLCRKAHATDIEHIISLARGGTDDAYNLALACATCNIEKSDQLVAFDVPSGRARYYRNSPSQRPRLTR